MLQKGFVDLQFASNILLQWAKQLMRKLIEDHKFFDDWTQTDLSRYWLAKSDIRLQHSQQIRIIISDADWSWSYLRPHIVSLRDHSKVAQRLHCWLRHDLDDDQ